MKINEITFRTTYYNEILNCYFIIILLLFFIFKSAGRATQRLGPKGDGGPGHKEESAPEAMEGVFKKVFFLNYISFIFILYFYHLRKLYGINSFIYEYYTYMILYS